MSDDHQTLEGWNPIGTVFRTIATERLVEMGWSRSEAGASISELSSNEFTLKPIIDRLRGHKVYQVKSSGIIDLSNLPPNVELVEQGPDDDLEETNESISGSLNEVQIALGSAHFQIRDFIHEKRVGVRGTMFKHDEQGSTVERHASLPESFVIDKAQIRRGDGKMRMPIPDYNNNRIGGTQLIQDRFVDVSEVEIFIPSGFWAEIHPADLTPDHARIEVSYSENRHATFLFGSRRGTTKLNQHIAALICILIRGQSSWIRWDLLGNLGQKVIRNKTSDQEIIVTSGIGETGVIYREERDRVRDGLSKELTHLAAELPWLYGHLGNLTEAKLGALEVDSAGQGVRYNCPIVWNYAVVFD